MKFLNIPLLLTSAATFLHATEKPNVIIIMTDNGTTAGWITFRSNEPYYNAGMRGWKSSAYEGGHLDQAIDAFVQVGRKLKIIP